MFFLNTACKLANTDGIIAYASGLFLLMMMACSSPLLATEINTPAAVNKAAKPNWNELNANQKTILAPLSKSWESIDGINKRKWLIIAKRYPTMPTKDQQRAQERMREWAQLSPEQHRVARDSYARFQAMSPEKRAALIKSYQALPEEQKKKLAEENRKKTRLLAHKSVTKSVSPQSNTAPAIEAGTTAQQ